MIVELTNVGGGHYQCVLVLLPVSTDVPRPVVLTLCLGMLVNCNPVKFVGFV
jgi:hypothetical protein